jgi:hypothetical protein
MSNKISIFSKAILPFTIFFFLMGKIKEYTVIMPTSGTTSMLNTKESFSSGSEISDKKIDVIYYRLILVFPFRK